MANLNFKRTNTGELLLVVSYETYEETKALHPGAYVFRNLDELKLKSMELIEEWIKFDEGVGR